MHRQHGATKSHQGNAGNAPSPGKTNHGKKMHCGATPSWQGGSPSGDSPCAGPQGCQLWPTRSKEPEALRDRRCLGSAGTHRPRSRCRAGCPGNKGPFSRALAAGWAQGPAASASAACPCTGTAAGSLQPQLRPAEMETWQTTPGGSVPALLGTQAATSPPQPARTWQPGHPLPGTAAGWFQGHGGWRTRS